MIDELMEQIDSLIIAWHEAGRASFESRFPHIDYDIYTRKHIVIRRKYILLDEGPSGAFIVDIATQKVYRLKSKYGVPNKKKCLGTIGVDVGGYQLNQYRWW